ncbi:hypothetical protein HMPREF3100_07125 [Enterococcus sp. HMSC29A04]|uniref:hypothetical protein n=1 Tax=Enterococcus TaxID=1350 RepID=UPI0008A162C9|nr:MULTISPECIES: hypothetical protein [Enterococcus]OFT87660.1 hypothetical protein HMPREF3100_07125 [Enterococcus sp. HMSC29A04]OFU59003.1 hypothetical protein HMPREF3128_19730 [Enterococcus sp. HMSC14A10]
MRQKNRTFDLNISKDGHCQNYILLMTSIIGAVIMLLYVRFEKQEDHILAELEKRSQQVI